MDEAMTMETIYVAIAASVVGGLILLLIQYLWRRSPEKIVERFRAEPNIGGPWVAKYEEARDNRYKCYQVFKRMHVVR